MGLPQQHMDLHIHIEHQEKSYKNQISLGMAQPILLTLSSIIVESLHFDTMISNLCFINFLD